MALSCNAFANQTTSTTACQLINAPVCPDVGELLDNQYMLLLIDALARKLAIDLTDVPAADLGTVIQNARCSILDSQSFPEYDERKAKAMLAYLVNEAVCTL